MVSRLVWTLVVLAGAFASASESFGSVSSIEEFPSLVQVEIKVDLLWVQQCVASILTNRHVLSTASCFSGLLFSPEYRRIRAGTSRRGLDGIVLGVESRVLHPSYGLLGAEADLTVVWLDDYLTLSPVIQQVAILGQGIELPDGLAVQLAGWGTTVQGGESSDENLYNLQLVVHSNERCMNQYITSHIITENMVCAGLQYQEGRDFDSQDLGAPLYYSDTLVGILAFGETAGDQMPVVATNIGSYTEWIITVAAA